MEYRAELNTIVEKYSDILKDNLAGIYLHGSLALGCFTQNSDIDFLVVVHEPIDKGTARKLIDIILEIKNSPKKGWEMSVVLKKYCTEFEYPTPFELHYGNSLREKYENNEDYICGGLKDKDLAAHFMVTKHRGICLYGIPINEMFLNVPKDVFWDSVLYDIADAENDIIKSPVYHILNLCRAWAYYKEERILSKLEGGQWAIDKVDIKYKNMIAQIIDMYSNPGYKAKPDQNLLLEFVKEIYSAVNLSKK